MASLAPSRPLTRTRNPAVAAFMILLLASCGRPPPAPPGRPTPPPFLLAPHAREPAPQAPQPEAVPGDDGDESLDAADQYADLRRRWPASYSIDPDALDLVRDSFPETGVGAPDPETGIAFDRVALLGRVPTEEGGEARIVEVRRAIYGMLCPRGLSDVLLFDGDGVLVDWIPHWAADAVRLDEGGVLRNSQGPVVVTRQGLRGWVRCWDMPGGDEEHTHDPPGETAEPAELADLEALRRVRLLPCHRGAGEFPIRATLVGWVGDLAVIDNGRDVLVLDGQGTLVGCVLDRHCPEVRIEGEGTVVVGERVSAKVGPLGFLLTGAQVLAPELADSDPCGRYTLDPP